MGMRRGKSKIRMREFAREGIFSLFFLDKVYIEFDSDWLLFPCDCSY